MPRKRALLLVNWFGMHANVIMTLMAFGAFAIGIWTIILYTKLEDQSSRLSGIEIARIVEQRASNKSIVLNCRNSIPTITTANILIDTVKDDLQQRAATNLELAKNDRIPKQRQIRVRAARAAARKAGALKRFPARTREFCDELSAKLRADLVAKYGERVAQLEKEEDASQQGDKK